MDEKGAIEKKCAPRAGPEMIDPAQHAIGKIDRQEPQTVIDKMRHHIGEKHEAGGQTQIANHLPFPPLDTIAAVSCLRERGGFCVALAR